MTFVWSKGLYKTLLVSALLHYLILIISLLNTQNPQLFIKFFAPSSLSCQPLIFDDDDDRHHTNLSHIAFGMMGSVPTWPKRRGYLAAWWRPNETRGYVFLDRPPPPELLPWPPTAPPYRVVDDLSSLFRGIKPRYELMPRMVHAILELFREEHAGAGVRWVVMGDDDTLCFVDNIVDVLAEYDHTKYYYLGWHSENVMSNYWFSFEQAFGGGGIVMSYALARALVRDMEGCLVRYADSTSADLITMACISDIGVSLTPHKGIHQDDLRGDISGYLSAHPKVPLMTFHHFDAVEPIFPPMDRMQSTRHLMTAAAADQSRLLQQTICYRRQTNWSLSVSWGYSAQIYERIMPRSYLQTPIETFKPWASGPNRPFYMFNTRPRSGDPCEAPHFFLLRSVNSSADEIVTTYSRARPRALPPCLSAGGHSADSVSEIRVFSPPKKRLQIDICECCDIVEFDGVNADIRLRECKLDEIIV